MCFFFVNDYARHSGKESTCQRRSSKETQVPSLGQEDPLEKEMATTPVFLPGKFHGQRSLAGYNPGGHKELDETERARTRAHAHTHTTFLYFTSLSSPRL